MADQYTFDDDGDMTIFKSAWQRVLESLKGKVPKTVFERFLAPLVAHHFEDDVAEVVCPGRFVYEWTLDKYHSVLQESLAKELGRPIKLNLLVEAREKPLVASVGRTAISTAPTISDRPTFKPNPAYTFENFVVGRSNQLACAGARAVLESIGTRYNPLFIYGHPGLGKTHLLHAIANRILEDDPHFPIRYITAQQFMEDFVNALQSKRVDQFRRIQRSAQVWLIDDVQMILGKDRTQEEVFHTFNHLYSSGRQIVICSDRTPRDLLPMDERLRSRFESGLVADIQSPDTETRCAILRSKAKQEGFDLQMDIAMFLAENVPGSVRHLEGALTKLAAVASIESKEISLEMATSMVDDHFRDMVRAKPTFKQILEAVSKRTQIEVKDITSESRKGPVTNARHIAIYMTREITNDSWKHIGTLFGNRDHTSMMHGYKKVRNLINLDREFNALVRSIMDDVYPDH